jgi:hypothetical protein
MKPPNPRYKLLIDTLQEFVKENALCSQSEQNNWSQVLDPLEIGLLERVLWATAFLKSTNGVADKVSCGHFRQLVKNSPPITLDLHTRPYTRLHPCFNRHPNGSKTLSSL